MSPDRPKMSPDRSKMSPNCPKMSPNCPKMSPNCPKMSPNRPKMSQIALKCPKVYFLKCIFPKCIYPKCIFAKCRTRLACLLSFASLLDDSIKDHITGIIRRKSQYVQQISSCLDRSTLVRWSSQEEVESYRWKRDQGDCHKKKPLPNFGNNSDSARCSWLIYHHFSHIYQHTDVIRLWDKQVASSKIFRRTCLSFTVSLITIDNSSNSAKK